MRPPLGLRTWLGDISPTASRRDTGETCEFPSFPVRELVDRRRIFSGEGYGVEYFGIQSVRGGLPADRPECTLDPAGRSAGDRKRGRLILTTAFFGVLVVLPAVVLAVAGLAVVQRLVPLPLRLSHNAATGIIYAALYVMFGVTIGFSLFLVWQQYDAAQKMAESEAAHVEELYRLAEGFPEPERGRVQDLAASYARVVVEEEWPMMQQGRTSPRAGEIADELQRSIQVFEPRTEAEQELQGEGLTQVDELDEERALRLLEVREGLPPILWVVLITGGVITVAFTYLFGMETPWLHMLAVAALAVIVSLILYTIAVLEYPFDDEMRVGPDAFELVLHEIESDGGQ